MCREREKGKFVDRFSIFFFFSVTVVSFSLSILINRQIEVEEVIETVTSARDSGERNYSENDQSLVEAFLS